MIKIRLDNSLRNQAWNLFLFTRLVLVDFNIQEKTPEIKDILNISDILLVMSLSIFKILVKILLSPTDLLEYNENMKFSICQRDFKKGKY